MLYLHPAEIYTCIAKAVPTIFELSNNCQWTGDSEQTCISPHEICISLRRLIQIKETRK